jgi:hypothetical protein
MGPSAVTVMGSAGRPRAPGMRIRPRGRAGKSGHGCSNSVNGGSHGSPKPVTPLSLRYLRTGKFVSCGGRLEGPLRPSLRIVGTDIDRTSGRCPSSRQASWKRRPVPPQRLLPNSRRVLPASYASVEKDCAFAPPLEWNSLAPLPAVGENHPQDRQTRCRAGRVAAWSPLLPASFST